MDVNRESTIRPTSYPATVSESIETTIEAHGGGERAQEVKEVEDQMVAV